MGKARHMDAIKETMQNLVIAALNFPMGADVMEDGKVNTVASEGAVDVVEEKRALSTILVTSPLSVNGFILCGGCLLFRDR